MAKKKATKKKAAKKKSVSRKKTAAKKKSVSRKVAASNTYERDLSSAVDDALAVAAGASIPQASTSSRQETAEISESDSVLADWTIYTCNKVLDYVRSKVTAGGQVELDMSGIAEMDTSGFQILLACKNYLHSTQGELKLINPSAAVTEVLQRYRHDSEFIIA